MKDCAKGVRHCTQQNDEATRAISIEAVPRLFSLQLAEQNEVNLQLSPATSQAAMSKAGGSSLTHASALSLRYS